MSQDNFPPGFIAWSMGEFLKETASATDPAELLTKTKLWLKENVGPDMVPELRKRALSFSDDEKLAPRLVCLLGYLTMLEGRWLSDVSIFQKYEVSSDEDTSRLAAYFLKLAELEPSGDDPPGQLHAAIKIAMALNIPANVVVPDVVCRIAGRGLGLIDEAPE